MRGNFGAVLRLDGWRPRGRLSRAVAVWCMALLLGAWGTTPSASAQARAGTSLVVSGAPDGAEVYVDGELVGQAPLAQGVPVEPGSHTLRVTMPGYTEFTEVVRVRRGKPTTVNVEMIAVSMVLSLKSEPDGANVFVDDKFAGNTPLELDLLEGRHALKLSLFNYRDLVHPVDARAGVRDSLSLRLEMLPPAERKSLVPEPRDEWYEQPTTWLLIGGAAAVVATTVVLLVVFTASEPLKTDAFCAQVDDCVRVP